MSFASDFFNALPFETRKALSPLDTETRLNTLRAVRSMAVSNHKRFLAEMDKWISNLEETNAST